MAAVLMNQLRHRVSLQRAEYAMLTDMWWAWLPNDIVTDVQNSMQLSHLSLASSPICRLALPYKLPVCHRLALLIRPR